MTIPLAVPVMTLCLTTTEAEVNDGAYSSVARMNIAACTPCNPSVKECQMSPEFEKRVRDVIEKETARAATAAKSAEAEKPKKPTKRKTRRK